MKNLNDMSHQFAACRGYCEVEVARAMLSLPKQGVEIAVKLGLDAEHFQIHYDMRLAFCACMVCYEAKRGDDPAGILKTALERERYEWANRIERFRSVWDNASYNIWALAMFINGHRLIRLHVAERSAREHLNHARRLIAKEVAT